MKNQKAMSEIVTTVIMVVLALIAVGVIWGIINNLLGGKGAEIDITQKCLAVDVKAVKVPSCSGDLGNGMTGCNVTFERKAGGEAIKGIKIVFKNANGASNVIDSSGNIEELGTVTRVIQSNASIFNASLANKVEVTPYFTDDSGVERKCTGTAEYNF